MLAVTVKVYELETIKGPDVHVQPMMLTSERDEIECNFLIGYIVHSIQWDHPLDHICNFLIGCVVLFNGISHCTRLR